VSLDEEARAADERMAKRRGIVAAADIALDESPWLWAAGRSDLNGEARNQRMPAHDVTVLAGGGDVGKTTICAHVVAGVSLGTLPGAYFGTPREVLWLVEGEVGKRRAKKLLVGAGADQGRVFFEYFGRTGNEMMDVPTDLPWLQDLIDEHGLALVVFDNIEAQLDESIEKIYEPRTLRRLVLQPLRTICEQSETAMLLIRHPSRASADEATDKAGGSLAWSHVTRTFWYARLDPDEQDSEWRRGLLIWAKHNDAVFPPVSLAYEIRPKHEAELVVPEIVWLRERPEVTKYNWNAPSYVETEEESEAFEALTSGEETPVGMGQKLGITPDAARMRLQRLVKRGRIRRVAKGVYRPI
jgi:AAA domain/Transcriptional regulator, AbiEi antitoxin